MRAGVASNTHDTFIQPLLDLLLGEVTPGYIIDKRLIFFRSEFLCAQHIVVLRQLLRVPVTDFFKVSGNKEIFVVVQGDALKERIVVQENCRPDTSLRQLIQRLANRT